MQAVRLALAFMLASAGNNKAATMAMIAIVTINSINVKPCFAFIFNGNSIAFNNQEKIGLPVSIQFQLSSF